MLKASLEDEDHLRLQGLRKQHLALTGGPANPRRVLDPMLARLGASGHEHAGGNAAERSLLLLASEKG